MKKSLYTTALLWSLLSMSVGSFAQMMQWKEVAAGVWKVSVGKPEAYNLLTAAGAQPNAEALKKMGSTGFPLNRNDISVKLVDGKTYLRFPLDWGEQLYGFGLNFQTVHQRGRILQLHMDHYGNKDNGRTHAPVPFYVSSKGYGVFVNSARYIDVYAGTAVRTDSKNPPLVQDRNTDKNWQAQPYSDAVEMLVPAGGVELYVFGGPSSMEAVRRFNLFNGGGCLPPRWGLGFTQRVNRLYSDKDVQKEAAEFEEKGYPLDFIGLEPGWQSKSYPCTFEWDNTRFPQPAAFVKDMLSKGVRINLWTNPYVSPEASLYPKIAPYAGSHSVWVGSVVDLTIPKAQAVYWDQFDKAHVGIGVSGYKIDEVDGFDSWLWPDVATFPSGVSAEQMRQTYGLLVMKQSTELFRKHNRRTYGLVRASNAGGVSLPYVIYNDNYSHEDFITGLINSGFSGTLWTPEVRASKTGEEWLRRFQSVCFSPMAMINAWASSTKPWTFPEVADQIKEVAQLRMRMMPYWYSEFAKYHFEGTPPFHAVNLVADFKTEVKKEVVNANLEENPYVLAVSKEIKDQYMAGEYLLVAPMFTGQTSRKVVLPKGKWYDFYTGQLAGEGEVITVTPGLDKIPVFVKDGGIIPMMPVLLHAPQPNQKVDLEIRHYGQKNAQYRLYDDDGETFAYEKGQFSWRTLTAERGADGRWKGSISEPENGKPNTVGKVSWKFMTILE
ncbi:glycoside hydrolase family 31 protein [Runella slithyformis]|uniref:Alpha-glucosidase n=1 Tax=Runella slithyformis (strain ATCC 29530 / DSM 19594 / LMG 11500 / NCIMB 11436 / LSU 4) TaxID=761193 RepID=A0A7U4E7F5_RUNSL|nr:TIM-barrel domain-containing protein [Runella slithyformis]AEI50598.1 Alpha-glucosidase [Runella slithyformis DSM 19594]